MKTFLSLTSVCILVVLFVATAYAAKPPRCEDVPISLTFEDPITVPASMWNDDPDTPYFNGVIHYNGFCDGSRDATVGTDPGRFLWVQLPQAVPGSFINQGPPSFAGGSAFSTQGSINVRNITARNTGLVIPGPNSATFYTKVSFAFTGPDGNAYALAMLPDDITCPLNEVCAPNFTPGPNLPTKNSPEQTAWAKVTYTPSPDTWTVEGEFVNGADNIVQRSTLYLEPPNNGERIHYGQYSMPFRMVIKAQASLPITPQISINDVSITEGNSGTKSATFTMSLSTATSNAISVDYATSDGSANAPSDYSNKSGTISIPSGATSASVTIPIKGDRVAESAETFFVNLSDPVNGTLADGQGICTIIDND